MKELIKKRWFVFLLGILIAAIALLIFGLILYCNGYRIVYPEQFETSWDAVSGFAAWAGILVSIASAAASFMAVWYAVRVADKQNRIALFEKKYELFEIVVNCKMLSNAIKDLKTDLEVQMAFLAALCYSSVDRDKVVDNTYVSVKEIGIFQKLKQVPFLFENTEELDTLTKLISLLASLVSNNKKVPALQNRIQEFSDYINSEEYKKLVDAMQKELMLK